MVLTRLARTLKTLRAASPRICIAEILAPTRYPSPKFSYKLLETSHSGCTIATLATGTNYLGSGRHLPWNSLNIPLSTKEQDAVIAYVEPFLRTGQKHPHLEDSQLPSFYRCSLDVFVREGELWHKDPRGRHKL
ncbi:hypothetical protein ONZ45_g7110 [Pleurotus djamor]|nr:hypothetical protein ONZ45_g7110 [Pleurotus djamor]